MSDLARKNESLLFNYETTNRSDYRGGKIRPLVKTVYKPKKKSRRGVHSPLKDTQTITPWKDPHVPFDLYHKPDPITHMTPAKAQQIYKPLIDTDREHVQKTRPRVIMTPAMPLDDIEDSKRQKFIDILYCSESIRAMNDAVSRVKSRNVTAPLPGVYAPNNPLALESLNERVVSPEWRMESVSWDNRQQRSHTEPTREFWITRKPGTNCSVCKGDAIRRAMKKNKTLTST